MRAKFLIILLLAALMPAVHAWQTIDEEIFIEADSWDADRQTGIAVYRGNVRVVRGSVEIRGDELTLVFEDDELATATIHGTPVRFVQEHAGERPATTAQSREVVYTARDGIVRLRGSARISQAGDEFASDDIRYDTLAERVVAGGESGGRVRVTIQPRRQPPQDEPPPEPRL